ncbi:MAG: T9SS type A sorting domain-containing protein, partial [Sphingobacteriales bacterium]
ISLDKIFTDNSSDIDPNFWSWDPTLSGSYGVGGYQYFTKSSGYKATPGGAGNDSEIYNSADEYPNMQSGQAMYTKAYTANPTIVFNEEMKADSSLLVSRGTGVTENIPMISTMLYTSAGLLRDGNRVVFDEAYSDAVDRFDAIKLNNNGINFGLTRNNKAIAVEARSALKATDTLFYRMGALPTGDFKLGVSVENIQANGITAEMIDRYLNSRTPVPMTGTSFLRFSTNADPASKAADRFLLVFKQAVVLPVNFVTVSARREADNSIQVNWKVANEVNIVRYEVERSANGVQFASIGSKTAEGMVTYSQRDGNPIPADNFYRIKAIGLGNEVSYSSIVKITGLTSAPLISVYPNPVESKNMNIHFVNQPKGKYALELVNAAGQKVFRGVVKMSENNSVFQQRLENSVAAGHYLVNITGPEGATYQ